MTVHVYSLLQGDKTTGIQMQINNNHVKISDRSVALTAGSRSKVCSETDLQWIGEFSRLQDSSLWLDSNMITEVG